MSIIRLFCLAVAAAALPALAHADELSDQVVAEINLARTHPQAFGREIQRALWRDDAGSEGRETAAEEAGAVEETLAFLDDQRPMSALAPLGGLSEAARAHVALQSRNGEEGHGGSDGGFADRLHRRGVWSGVSGEDISYGYSDAADVVRQLIIDSRVPGRGHRKNIFDPTFRYVGVACGRHPRYGEMCVIDFAGALVER